MEIDFLVLADAAQVADGKMYVLGGGWSYVWVREFPTDHRLGMAIGVLVAWQETNQTHHFEVTIETEDGNPVLPPIQAELEVGRPPGIKAGSQQRAMLAINASVPLQEPGRYEVVVRVEGQPLKRTTFEAVRAERQRSAR